MDYIDVLQCEFPDRSRPLFMFELIVPLGHRFDYHTPIEETMQALHDVVKAGFVRCIGISSCFAWQCKLPAFHFLYDFLAQSRYDSPEDAVLRAVT